MYRLICMALDWTICVMSRIKQVFNRVYATVAFNIIQHVHSVSFSRVVFESWHNAAVDAERTRQYFEVSNSISNLLILIFLVVKNYTQIEALSNILAQCSKCYVLYAFII